MLNFLYDICIEVVIIPITFLLGLLTTKIRNVIFLSKYKKIMRLTNDNNMEVSCFTANTNYYDSDERVTLGYVFEYMSVGVLKTMLDEKYKNISFSCVMSKINFAENSKRELEKNIILIGGPFHNSVTKDIFSNDKVKLPFYFDNNANLIFLLEDGAKKIYKPCLTSGKKNDYFEKDYGVIINIKSPYNKKKRILAFMGCRSVGCYGAALFVDRYIEKYKKILNSDEYAIVVKCFGKAENIDGNPIFEAYYKLDTTS